MKLVRRLYPQAPEFEKRLSVYVHARMMIPVLFPVCAKRAVPRTYGPISPFHLFPMSFPCSPVLHFPMSPFTRLPLSPFPHFPIPPQTVWHQIGRSMWCHRPCGTTLGTPDPCCATSCVAPHWASHVVPQAVWHHIGDPSPMWCHKPHGVPRWALCGPSRKAQCSNTAPAHQKSKSHNKHLKYLLFFWIVKISVTKQYKFQHFGNIVNKTFSLLHIL